MENLLNRANLKTPESNLITTRQFFIWLNLFTVWSLILMFFFGYLNLIDHPWYFNGYYEPFLFIIPIFIYKPIRKWLMKQWGFRQFLRPRLYVVFVVGIIVYFLIHYMVYYNMFNHFLWYLQGLPGYFFEKTQHSSATHYQSWSIILLGCVIVPICEEAFFRGILMNFLKKRYNLWIGLIVSSVFFTIGHFDLGVDRLIALMVSGIIFGLVTHFSKSIVPAIIIHGIWNFIAIIFVGHVISVFQLF